jgi:hypothetical protein
MFLLQQLTVHCINSELMSLPLFEVHLGLEPVLPNL